jgi:hypothetical protein
MKNKIRTYLSYLPLLILLVSAAILIWTISSSDIVLTWKHYIGLVLLAIATVLFFIRHLYGVLLTAVILLLGLIGILSYSPAITMFSFGWGTPDKGVTLLVFQPIFLLWTVIYCIVSGRHFVGIASREYWVEVRNGQR